MAERSALADGTLDPERRAEVQARVEESEDLRRSFEEERRAALLLQTARERDRAPIGLRERIESDRRRGSRTKNPWFAAAPRLAGAGALVLVVVLALVLSIGSASEPSVAQAAALGALGPTGAAPGPQASDPARLDLASGSLHFPNWARSVGWRATGQRSDEIAGRRVLTVYYARGGSTVAYSIVSGPPLAWPRGVSRPAGPYLFRAFRLHGRTVVSWREAGHTCVLSAAGLPVGTMAALIYHP